MFNQLIVVYVSGLLSLVGLRVFISRFDDDDNDGNGMIYPDMDNHYFSILERA